MLQDLSDLQDNMSEVYRTTVIKVDGKQTLKLSLANTNAMLILGMTCHSCVRNITNQVSEKGGIESVEVSLEDGRAMVSYDPSVTDPAIIASKSQR